MTNITIHNDDLNKIMDNPQEFVNELMTQINSKSKRKEGKILKVNSVEHSSVTTLIAVGGNHSTTLGFSSNECHHNKNDQIKILNHIKKNLKD